MSTITVTFEEVALTLGKDHLTGRPQRIALLTGSCEIEGRPGNWEVTDVTLQGPILHDADVRLHHGHPLFAYVADSIAQSKGDEIFDLLREAGRSDPDHARDRRRDDAMMGVA